MLLQAITSLVPQSAIVFAYLLALCLRSSFR